MRDFIKNYLKYFIFIFATINTFNSNKNMLYFTLRQSSYLMLLIKFNCYGTGNAI